MKQAKRYWHGGRPVETNPGGTSQPNLALGEHLCPPRSPPAQGAVSSTADFTKPFPSTRGCIAHERRHQYQDDADIHLPPEEPEGGWCAAPTAQIAAEAEPAVDPFVRLKAPPAGFSGIVGLMKRPMANRASTLPGFFGEILIEGEKKLEELPVGQKSL
ncbi:MAG: hypothetical protein GX442_22760 [Candidatus Riflebacteria bacterium]|nr:hypothetical protein [Candidatus Riflebacteria bacterium]